MPFKLIKGTFHVTGYSPDGDSIRFKANDLSLWDEVEGIPDINHRGHVQLRFEGIDTLETHYKNYHQPKELGLQAMEYLLESLHIRNVQWNANGTQIAHSEDETEGFILVRTMERYGRAVAFVFSGASSYSDGNEVYLEEDLLKESINYKMTANGLAYPTFYNGLFFDLREELSKACERARQAGLGVHANDRTNSGAEVTSLRSITNEHVMLPKLFRRLIKFSGGETPDLSKFEVYLARKPEPILLLDTKHFTHFDTVVEVEGNVVSLIVLPENIVFLS